MRNIFFALLGFMIVVASAACRKTSTASCDDPVFFNLKDTVTLCFDGVAKWSKDTKTTIRFTKVLGDNRCPKDVMCIMRNCVAKRWYVPSERNARASDRFCAATGRGLCGRVRQGGYGDPPPTDG